MPLPGVQLHQYESTPCQPPRQHSPLRNEEGHEDVWMVLGHIAYDDKGGPKDDNRRSIYPRTVLRMQNGRMPPTVRVAKGIGTSILSSTCRTHAKKMESIIPMLDSDVEDDN
jgi:hypothetical protein